MNNRVSLTAVQLKKCFKLGRGTGQGDLISVILFISILQIFIYTRSKPEIDELAIFKYNYPHSRYADDTIIFLNCIISIKHIVDTFFVLFRIKTNLTKSKITSIGVRKTEKEKNVFKNVTDTPRVSKILKMRNLTVERKIVIFKTIVISKNSFQIIKPFVKVIKLNN